MQVTKKNQEYSVPSEQRASWKVSSSLLGVTGLCDFTGDSSGCVCVCVRPLQVRGRFFITLKLLYPEKAGFFFCPVFFLFLFAPGVSSGISFLTCPSLLVTCPELQGCLFFVGLHLRFELAFCSSRLTSKWVSGRYLRHMNLHVLSSSVLFSPPYPWNLW